MNYHVDSVTNINRISFYTLKKKTNEFHKFATSYVKFSIILFLKNGSVDFFYFLAIVPSSWDNLFNKEVKQSYRD